MADLIDRKAAIDALHSWERVYNWDETCREDTEKVYAPSDAIKDLPTAEPERKTVAEERYEDLCEYFRNDQDAIKAILHDRKEFKAWLERMHWHVTECDKMGRELEAQKSKRKPGRWERHYSRPNVFADLFWHCSCCGYKNENQYANVYHKFCPNCGARMDGGSDDG